MKKYCNRFFNKEGFTLVELLVAMAISGVIMAAVYSSFYSQQKSYNAQQQVVEMHQNIRVAMFRIAKEIRLAGIDPRRTSGARIVTADSNTINFTMDENSDGVADGTDSEDVTYALSDNDGDGDLDLERNNNLIAENIDALDFVYLDEDRFILPTPVANTDDIRSIQLSVVARTGRGDLGFTDTTIYTNQQGTVILAQQNDRFRRKLLTAEIKCRNLFF